MWLLTALEGYKTDYLTAIRYIDGSSIEGLLWADPRRLEVLCRRGYLSFIDSTYDTNWLGWFLYTVIVRDEWGSCCPAAHFLTQKGDSNIIIAALKKLREWTGGKERWKCRWFLTDDSATEQRAVCES
jgi:hypothetical protein